MKDALGAMQSVLVLGGTSEIALATVEALVAGRCRTVVLAVRDPDAAIHAADSLRRAGADRVEVIAFDAAQPATHTDAVGAAFDLVGDIDLVISAFGVLGDQSDFDADPAAAAAAAQVNYVGVVSSGLAVADRLRRQGHGTLLVISSVAGIRARRDNFVYGSSKAGADAFTQGLGDALVGTGARTVVVRPGFVHTRMTEGMTPAPFSTTPDKVAATIVDGLARGREVIWAPPVLRYLFAVLGHLPRPLWRIVSRR
ncbi:MAG: decaprenylphospho-beta-D-erythro-pentofuranosid-2-ulose 2-reductase [Acidimicrobiales bacterium]|jgi:decaprenylphospho-beta-D-erythro-pentofuranosid-2-ulose 2-reductase|nr:decaprenylphospho-beta-D-erythro-pentofuranosid-2-ulose 2-reductase [Acidimicrobiales bacterium]